MLRVRLWSDSVLLWRRSLNHFAFAFVPGGGEQGLVLAWGDVLIGDNYLLLASLGCYGLRRSTSHIFCCKHENRMLEHTQNYIHAADKLNKQRKGILTGKVQTNTMDMDMLGYR